MGGEERRKKERKHVLFSSGLPVHLFQEGWLTGPLRLFVCGGFEEKKKREKRGRREGTTLKR